MLSIGTKCIKCTQLTQFFHKDTMLLMKTVTARFARQHFADILNEVHFGRKKILITRSGKPLVILISSRDYGEKEKKSKK